MVARGRTSRRFVRMYVTVVVAVAFVVGIASVLLASAGTAAWLVFEVLFWSGILFAILDPADPRRRRQVQGRGAARDDGGAGGPERS